MNVNWILSGATISVAAIVSLIVTTTAQAVSQVSNCQTDGSQTVRVCMAVAASSYEDKRGQKAKVDFWEITPSKLDRRANVALENLEITFGCGGVRANGRGVVYKSQTRTIRKPVNGRTYKVSLLQCKQYLSMNPGYHAASASLRFSRAGKVFAPVQLNVTAAGAIPSAGYPSRR